MSTSPRISSRTIRCTLGSGLDREGMKQGAELFRVAAPGARHEITMQVAEGDLVVSYIVGCGVHEGALLGIPATHK